MCSARNEWAGLLPLRLDDPKAFYLHMPWLASMLAEVEQHSQPVGAQLQQLQQRQSIEYTRVRSLPRAVVSASGTPRPPRLRRLTLQHSV